MNDLHAVEILLAEDSAADAEMTIRALRKHNLANRLVWVKDGAEALDFIYRRGSYEGRTNGQPRLVLLDLKMPRVDGIEVLQQIKGDPETRAIPVVVLTSSAEERDIVNSYELGVNSYLVKPVDFNHFLEVVAQAGLYWAVLNRVPREGVAAPGGTDG